MQTIDLECPQCQTLLELDAGFAGGVCRCSNCGTLMTVPADPRREKAETLKRPDRPDSPAPRRPAPQRPAPSPPPASKPAAKAPLPPPPKKPAAPPARPSAPPAAAQPPAKPVPPPAPVAPPPAPTAPAQPVTPVTESLVPPPPPSAAPTPAIPPPPAPEEEAEVVAEAEEGTVAPSDPAATPASAKPAPHETAPQESSPAETAETIAPSATRPAAQDDSADTQTYVTASGKVIRVSARKAIPMARKKREGVRFVVVLVVLLILGGVVGATIFAVMLLRPAEKQPEVKIDNNDAVSTIDPNVNPFKMPRGNYLGIVMRQRVTIVIDTGPRISQWRALAKDAVAPGLAKATKDIAVQVVLVSEKNGAAVYPDAPRSLAGQAELDTLSKFFEQAEPVGNAPPAPAIKKALESNPQQVIYVTGKTLAADEVQAIASEFNGRGGVRFDAVLIDSDSVELAKLVKQQAGRCITPNRQLIVKWLGEIEPPPEQ